MFMRRTTFLRTNKGCPLFFHGVGTLLTICNLLSLSAEAEGTVQKRCPENFSQLSQPAIAESQLVPGNPTCLKHQPSPDPSVGLVSVLGLVTKKCSSHNRESRRNTKEWGKA